jgi:magnesium-transporting ATPase (P-type)
MVLLQDSLEDVVMAVTKGRSYNDHLMKFILMQIPCSVTAIGMVLTQVFLYETILITGVFIFLINLIYFPIGIACIVRENAASRYPDMIERWRSVRYPGTKTITGYMRSEYIKFSIFIVTLFQVGSLYGLYYHADKLLTLVDARLDWSNEDPLYVD